MCKDGMERREQDEKNNGRCESNCRCSKTNTKPVVVVRKEKLYHAEVVHCPDRSATRTKKRRSRETRIECDACPLCMDTCGLVSCKICAKKKDRPGVPPFDCRRHFTWCEIRRHCTAEDSWLVKDGNIYDVSGMVSMHPGGEEAIVRHAGGRNKDCTRDFHFHSRKAQKLWEKFKIGRVVPCPNDGRPPSRCETSSVHTCAIC